MASQLERRYVDGDYHTHNPTWHEEHGETKARWIQDILVRNSIVPKTIAEVGCGSGQLLVHLKERYPAAQLTGFEISPQGFEICAPKNADGLDFRCEDFFEAQTIDYDLLLAIDVFEHVPDYLGFLRKLKSKADCKLFHIPLDLSVQSLARATTFPILRNQSGHLHYFFKDTAIATLRDCGYEIVDWKYTRSSQELPGKSFRTKLANVPRKLMQRINEDLSVRFLGGCSLLVLAR